jgi:hypothetical protein
MNSLIIIDDANIDTFARLSCELVLNPITTIIVKTTDFATGMNIAKMLFVHAANCRKNIPEMYIQNAGNIVIPDDFNASYPNIATLIIQSKASVSTNVNLGFARIKIVARDIDATNINCQNVKLYYAETCINVNGAVNNLVKKQIAPSKLTTLF